MDAEILVWVARDTLLRRYVLSKDLKEIREPDMWISGSRLPGRWKTGHKSSEMGEILVGSSIWKNEGFN